MKSVIAVVAVVAVFLLLNVAVAQEGSPVNPTAGPPATPYQKIFAYTGTNLEYICVARSNQQSVSTITVSAASNANPVSFTATAHGFDYQSAATTTPVVTITGATGNWTPINGTWKATPTSANAFTIAVNSTTFGALTGTLVVTTRAAKTTDARWAIQRFVYDGSNNLIWSGWAANPAGAGSTNTSAGSTGFDFACASRTTYSYQ